MKFASVGVVSLFCLATVFSAAPQAISASGKDGDFAVRGAGLIDCKTYRVERKKRSRAYAMMGGWIDGYLTGINQYAPDTYDATSFESTELFARLIAERCKSHPDDRLFAIMNAIVKRRWADRITHQSPQVTIAFDGRKVRLYSETIERIQRRLKRKGFLASPPTGAFNPATRKALAAFQKTLKGYKPTGFPDQATLFMLFRR